MIPFVLRDIPAAREAQRLQTLDSVALLDTPPDTFTDAVVGAAAAIANTPFAAISLLDRHRQWFKGACGFERTETPRDISFCTHAIRAPAPFVVEDAQLDPRFRDSPFVTGGMHIRFYAGFPLVVDRQALGALCVLDDHPRRLTPSQLDRLGDLAAGTVAWIVRRRREGAR